MAMKELDAALTAALSDAVRELERRSRAEIVIEMRRRAGSYAHADARFASLAAFCALLFLLFSPWLFAPVWVAVDVAAVWGIALFLAGRSDSVRRWMTTRRERDRASQLGAAAAFHERGVAGTSGETGVLLFFSKLERRLQILADRAVLEAVPALEWNRVVEEARDHEAAPQSLVRVMLELAPLLERHLPLRDGDVDELANAPRFGVE